MEKQNWCAVLVGCAVTLAVGVESASAASPLCVQPCMKGDVNNDTSVSNLDIGPFLDVLLGLNVDPVAVCAADVNGDGDTNGIDIDGLVSSLLCACGCTVETDCALGETCVDGLCQPAAGADLELSDNNAPCVTTGYARLESGGIFNLCEGFQGLDELFLTIRATGFAPNAVVDAHYELTLPNPDACTSTCTSGQEFCYIGRCVLGARDIFGATMTDIGGGVNEFTGMSDILFQGVSFLDGLEAILTVTVTDAGDPLLTTTLSICVELNVFEFCIFPTDCPLDHNCVGGYCVPI